MNRKTIDIFEFPSNLGLKKKAVDSEPGVRLLPGWFKQNQFHDLISPNRVFELQPPEYSMEIDLESKVRNADKIVEYAKCQAALLNEHLNLDQFFIGLGGDCSILIGIAIALKQKGNYALFFLDGHTDYVSPDISESKAVAAMELAIVTGYGHNKLTNILNLAPYFEAERVWCVGNREYNREVIDEISNSKLSYIDLESLRSMGIRKCATRFLRMVEDSGVNGFFIHLDVDVLNDDIMPAVDSRRKGGLQYYELNQVLSILLGSNKAIGMEITILDPTLDKNAIYTKELILNLTQVINTVVKPSPNIR